MNCELLSMMHGQYFLSSFVVMRYHLVDRWRRFDDVIILFTVFTHSSPRHTRTHSFDIFFHAPHHHPPHHTTPKYEETLTMKFLAFAALFSTTGAFAPVHISIRLTALDAVAGDEVRIARSTYATHGTGEIGSFNRGPPCAPSTPAQSVMGEDVRHSRSTYATHGVGEIGSTNRAPPRAPSAPSQSVMGEDVRHARSTYAAHGVGEVGSVNRAAPSGFSPRRDCAMGEDVRHARSTYASHGTGIIGSDERVPFVPSN